MKYKRKTTEDIRDNYALKLLIDRGILSKEDVNWPQWYSNPTANNLCDPLLLDNMEIGF